MEIVLAKSFDHVELDKFVAQSVNGTFIQSPTFLSYHGQRFSDMSVCVVQRNKLLGFFPAAIAPNSSKCVMSHPGTTFGGLIHTGKLNGIDNLSALQAICKFYRDNGFTSIHYKAIPFIYQWHPGGDDLYSLFRLNAHLTRCDLNCVIDLQRSTYLDAKSQSKMRNQLRKSEKSGFVTVSSDSAALTIWWKALSDYLSAKFHSKPTHSFEEITYLLKRFPDNIEFVAGLVDDEVVSGTVLFKDKGVIHTQYLYVNEVGRQVFALDALIQKLIEEYKAKGFRYFSFGISNEDHGRYLNETLYASKTKHGGLGVAHQTFEIDFSVLTSGADG